MIEVVGSGLRALSIKVPGRDRAQFQRPGPHGAGGELGVLLSSAEYSAPSPSAPGG